MDLRGDFVWSSQEIGQVALRAAKTLDQALESLADFQLGDAWATDRRASLSDLTGKAVALFFRRAGDARSAGIMGKLSRFCAGEPDMETVALCFRLPGQDADAELEKLRQEIQKMEYKGIAGFDPDGEGQSLFRTFKAGVGSASLYILDSRGEVVWIMEDPRYQDFAFAKAVLLRAAGR